MEKIGNNIVNLIERHRVIAIMRHLPEDQLLPVFSALDDAGIQLIEITMNTSAAAAQISRALEHFSSRMVIGAGTVSTPDRAREAIAAGAQFLVTPNLDLQVVRLARQADCPVVPGVMTPTEMMTAVSAGVPALKLFPAGRLGPAYVKDILAPLDDLKIIAVGGVTPENARSWIEAGCIGVGMGSSLIDKDLLQQRQYAELAVQVRQMVRTLLD